MNRLNKLLYDILTTIGCTIKPKSKLIISVKFKGNTKSHPATWAYASDKKVSHAK